jgi:hypothetical protein
MAERESGLLPPPEFYEDVPEHLTAPLMSWARRILQDTPDVSKRVALRLRAGTEKGSVPTVLTMLSEPC